jgi:hypothetical protein
MVRSSLALFLLGVLLSSCALASASSDAVEIRVANRSTRAFDRVIVGFSDGQRDYGALPAGAVSEYRTVAEAYRYAYFEVRLDTARLVIQPIDFVGETPLRGGRYTYALSLTPDRNLTFELERD